MSSQVVAADVISVPSSHAASAATQPNIEEAHHESLSAITQENLNDSIDAINKLSISSAQTKRLAVDITFEEATEGIRAVDEPLYQSMLNHHEAVKKVRSDELDWMRTTKRYHRKLERFPGYVTEKNLSQAETDRRMENHSARLLEYDEQLRAWFAHRGEENNRMLCCYNRAVEENTRRLQEKARHEERDRRGYSSRCSKDRTRRELDHEHRIKEHHRWELEYNFWTLTYDRFSQDRERNLKEYKALFMRQAHFTRIVGNYQVYRFFDEVERLNSVADESVKEKPNHASEVKESSNLGSEFKYGDEVSRECQNSVEGKEAREVASDDESCAETKMEMAYRLSPSGRRYTL